MTISRTVYVRGISKHATLESIRLHFVTSGEIESINFKLDAPREGFGWVTFVSQSSADRSIKELHHSMLHGSIISVRYELGIDKTNEKHITQSIASPQIPKSIMLRTENNKNRKDSSSMDFTVYYTNNGIRVNTTEYPTCQGNYLMKLLKICHSNCIGNRQPLVDALLTARHGNKGTKELTESMSMVNAILTLGQLTGVSWENEKNVRVFVLGDGLIPHTAITVGLFFPISWQFISIDPLLNFNSDILGPIHAPRFTCVPKLSQDYIIDNTYIPVSSEHDSINIVIACHSHAPIEEFWTRLNPTNRNYCASLPCCGKKWSVLEHQLPLSVYEDYEVISPKRKVFLYANNLALNASAAVVSSSDFIITAEGDNTKSIVIP